MDNKKNNNYCSYCWHCFADWGKLLFYQGRSKLDVETERITISAVTKGKFQENIPVNGVVLPLTTIYLDAVEGGRVEEKYVDDGAMMKKDQPILRLSNTDLELGLVNQKPMCIIFLRKCKFQEMPRNKIRLQNLNQMTDVESH